MKLFAVSFQMRDKTHDNCTQETVQAVMRLRRLDEQAARHYLQNKWNTHWVVMTGQAVGQFYQSYDVTKLTDNAHDAKLWFEAIKERCEVDPENRKQPKLHTYELHPV